MSGMQCVYGKPSPYKATQSDCSRAYPAKPEKWCAICLCREYRKLAALAKPSLAPSGTPQDEEPDFPTTGRGHHCNLCKEKDSKITALEVAIRNLQAVAPSGTEPATDFDPAVVDEIRELLKDTPSFRPHVAVDGLGRIYVLMRDCSICESAPDERGIVSLTDNLTDEVVGFAFEPATPLRCPHCELQLIGHAGNCPLGPPHYHTTR